MSKKVLIAIVIVVLALIILVLAGSGSDNGRSLDRSDITAPPSSSDRSFYMTTGAFFGYSLSEIKEGAQFTKDHGDIAPISLTSGVPWDEALADEFYPIGQDTFVDIGVKEYKNEVILLGLGFTDAKIRGLNNDLDENSSATDRTGIWKDIKYDDPRVISAYINYSRHLIDKVKPNYFLYGGEVDLGFSNEDDPAFEEMLTFMKEVYTTLKEEYPKLPIFVSVATLKEPGKDAAYLSTVEKIMQYSDLIGMTSFPYLVNKKYIDPKEIPDNWYSRVQALAPEKRIALMEVSTPGADTVRGSRTLFESNEEFQAKFLEQTLTQMNELNAEIIIWSPSAKDLDFLFVEGQSANELFRVWHKNGLMDGEGNERKAYGIWHEYLGE